MNVGSLFDILGLDRYDREARLKPAVYAIAPVFLVVLLVTGVHRPIPAVLLLGVVAYFLRPLMESVRDRGREVERDAGSTLGNARTARLLRHDDGTLLLSTKETVRRHVRSRYGIELPDTVVERQHPDRARKAYLEAARQLASEARAESGRTLLLDENISYGFRRNLLGIKSTGLAIVTGAFVASLIVLPAGVNGLPGTLGWGIPLVLLLSGFMWWKVDRTSVEVASQRYAERLLDTVTARARHADVDVESS